MADPGGKTKQLKSLPPLIFKVIVVYDNHTNTSILASIIDISIKVYPATFDDKERTGLKLDMMMTLIVVLPHGAKLQNKYFVFLVRSRFFLVGLN